MVKDSFELIEYADSNLIMKCLKSPLLLQEHAIELKKYYDSIEKGNGSIRVKYTKKGNLYGRYYPDSKILHPLYQWRHLRSELYGRDHIEIDAVKCHPTLLVYIANKYNFPCANVRDYINNREKYINDLDITDKEIQFYNDRENDTLTRDELCKKIMNMSLFNVSKKSLTDMLSKYPFKSGSISEAYSKEVKLLMKNIVNLPEYENLKNSIKSQKQSKRPHDGTYLSYILQDLEADAVYDLIQILKEHNICVTSYIYDGILVKINSSDKNEMTKLNNILNGYNKYGLSFIVKQLSKPLLSLELNGKLRSDEDIRKVIMDDLRLVDELPNTLNLNDYKKSRFVDVSDEVIEKIAHRVMGHYFIRCKDMIYKIDPLSKLIIKYSNSQSGYSKTQLENTLSGTILYGYHHSDAIKHYDEIVLKDPMDVKDNEYNIYGELKYDRYDSEPLNEEELKIIEPIIYHHEQILCGGDKESYNMNYQIFGHKFLKPFEVNNLNGFSIFNFGPQGYGKTIFYTTLFNNAFGEEYVNSSIRLEELMEKTDSIEGKLVCIFPDMPAYSMKTSYLYNDFKPYVSDKYRRQRMMYLGASSVLNTVLYIGCSNNRNALHLDGDDRRFHCIECGVSQVNSESYISNLKKCIDDNYRLFIRYCISKIPNKLYSRPPITKLKAHSIQNSLCSVGQFLNNMLSNGWNPMDNEKWNGHRREFYGLYTEYCKEENIRGIAKLKEREFFQSLYDKFYFDTKETNANMRIFIIRNGCFELLKKACGWDGFYEN